MDLHHEYKKLLNERGPQGWWPINSEYREGYKTPENDYEAWEICVGAILTQNTNWGNVEKALFNLRKEGKLGFESFLKMRTAALARLIRSSGYYNQKAVRLKEFARAVSLKGVGEFLKTVTREELLSFRGIGPETADSLLLYAGKRPFFVVDAYTRRLFGLDGSYENIRALFEKQLPRDWTVYNEFHALIVAEGKCYRPLSKK